MNSAITVSSRKILVLGAIAVLASILPFALRPALAASGPSLTVTATANVPNAATTITGSGFNGGEIVHLTFGAKSVDVTADGSGNITGSLPIPSVPAGLQVVSSFGETSGKWALAYLWVAGFNPAVSPNSWYILPGAPLSFTGTGFAPSENVTATYASTVLGTFHTDAAGNFSGAASSSLPVSLSNTSAAITFTGSTSGVHTSVTITIGQLYPSITPSTWYAPAGSTISLTGSGFAPNEPITVAAGTVHASSTANSSGVFTLASLVLPAHGGAATTVTATGGRSGAVATASIFLSTVTPWISFSTYWAQGGSPLTITGNNFAPSEQVGFFSGGTAMGTTSANALGNLSFITSVPFAPAGTATITGTGGTSGASASSQLTIAPIFTNLQLKNYAGAPSSTVEFIGQGYLPNEPVRVTTDRTGGTVVATFNTDNGGSFDNSSYVIPANFVQGNLTFTVTGTHSFTTKNIVYFVTGK